MKVPVQLPQNGYDIDLRADLSGLLETKFSYQTMLLVTDSNVGPLYAQQVQDLLRGSGIEASTYVLPAGEGNKTLLTVSGIYQSAISAHLDRKGAIVALGGGVVGDIAGFAAATYMRGVDFWQIPTTLLAQIDSSVGGKVGVDFGGYKNMVGAFYQPKGVLISTDLLKTLPPRELRAGFAEAVKYGVICDRAFFDFLSNQLDDILQLKPQPLQALIRRCCEIKAQVVQEDEKEQGLRMILNFGHTVGHAIESVSGFALLHGECVALGMVVAEYLAQEMGLFSEGVEPLCTLLQRAGLPVSVSGISKRDVLDAMTKDKKHASGKLRFVLPRETGKVEIVSDVPPEAVEAALGRVLY